jgi:hypothetical protein
VALPFGTPPGDAARHEAVLSFVMPEQTDKVRGLPLLYFGKTPLFASREIEAVKEHLVTIVELIADSRRRPTYLLHPCDIDGRRCLYGVDVFNRSPYRRRLTRLGATFSGDNHVGLSDEGSFSSKEWGDFSPEFIITSVRSEDPDHVETISGALLLLVVSPSRLGMLTASELQRLRRALEGTKGAGSVTPRALFEFIRSS